MATVSLSKVVTPQLKQPVDLEIPDGRLAVVTGARGSGKSNILRAIAGLEKVCSGEIRVGDKRVNEQPPHRRDVAMVFADDSLYPQMTVRDNIAFGLKRRRFGATEIKKRIEETAAILSLADLLKQKPNALSFGLRQRVAIARAVVRQPKVLLFDDAFGHVNDESREALGKEITMLHERLGATTIFATANVREALSMAEVIAIFDRGALQAFGPPRALYEQPGNIFVAEFFGRPPMNFIRGEIKRDRGALRFHEAVGGTIELDLTRQERLNVTTTEPMILGIRAEDIEVAERARAPEHSVRFRAIVESVLPFGSGTDVYFYTGAHAGVCRSAGWLDREQIGRRIEFVVNLEKVHFFCQTSGKSIV